MKTSQIVQGWQDELAKMAAMGDPAIEDAARRLSSAMAGVLSMGLLACLTEVAQEVSSQLPDGRVEVRLPTPDEPEWVFVPDERTSQNPAVEDDASARVTLRLPQWLKSEMESRAAHQDVSLNTWMVSSLTDVVNRRPRPSGKRIRGYGQS